MLKLAAVVSSSIRGFFGEYHADVLVKVRFIIFRTALKKYLSC